MEKLLQNFDKEIAKIEISGGKFLKGSIIEISNEIVVLFNGTDYLYIPIDHIQNLKVNNDNEDQIDEPTEPPSINKDKEELTLTQVLIQAQGMYIEIFATGKLSLSGYISNIMDDFIVFQSPIYKSQYIAIKHLKWLIPYSSNKRPYELAEKTFDILPYNGPLSNTLESQVEKMKNKLVVINNGEETHYIGKLNNVVGKIVEIKTARSTSAYINMDHFKTIQEV
ncbi:DUF2642 domain-containing protein [Rummeliibacillus sp. NPDC094406]|uniref:DUF2642 domain-containing protein n=1 Tax=Rummeliibacillus sp. NPDC094406 TaxID=3364511 RepID=UPI0038055676